MTQNMNHTKIANRSHFFRPSSHFTWLGVRFHFDVSNWNDNVVIHFFEANFQVSARITISLHIKVKCFGELCESIKSKDVKFT